MTQIIDGHTALIGDIHDLKESVNSLEQKTRQADIGYAGIGVGFIGISIAVLALVKSTRN